jgi:plasmid stability protein
MSNSYDEIKKLLRNSRDILHGSEIQESRETLLKSGLIVEMDVKPENIAIDSEEEIELDTEQKEDKQKSYRVSGGIITLHGEDKQDLELSTDEKMAFQETMDEFVDGVSDLSDFETLNLYEDNVDWSGNIIDYDIQFYLTIGEKNGVYINGNMIKLDDELIELVNKLTVYYEKFKSKWAKIIAQRKKTNPGE